MTLPRILRTASFRLAALYVVLFTASVVVLGVVAYLALGHAVEGQMRKRIAAETTSLTTEYQEAGLAGLVTTIGDREHGAAGFAYLVQDRAGKRLAGNLVAIAPMRGWTRLRLPEHGGDHEREHPFLARVVPLADGTLLAVAEDLDPLQDALEATLATLAWILAVTALLGIAGGLLLSRGFLRRVDAMSRTAEAIIAGDLARRIPLRGTNDDLDRLAATLNHMLDRIATLMESVRQVSSDIAHDLRTPLARLLQRLDTVRTGVATKSEIEATLETASGEVNEILSTFAALLQIAQIEAGAERAAPEDVDLSLVAETVAEAFSPSADELGHRILADVEQGVHAPGSRELLTQLLVNLVENALRHTPLGTTIRVELGRDRGGRAVLSVADNGPGIPEEERARVLDRFYRCERSRTTPGNGLGLSLVAAIAAFHGAVLVLEDAEPGLRVRVTLRLTGTSPRR